MFETIWKDIRHGSRMLVRNPGFSLVAIVSIAIGVGANAAMFSLADAMLLRPLPVERPDEIVTVNGIAPEEDGVRPGGMSYRDYVDLRDRARSFAGLVAYQATIASFAESRDQPAQSKFGFVVSGNFFDVLGVRPVIGRTFLPDEDRVPGRDAVVVLSHDTWTRQFGSDPRITERRLRLGGDELTIVGVAPASFSGLDPMLHPAFYVPIAMLPRLGGTIRSDVLERRDRRTLTVKARVRKGVSFGQAGEEVRLIAQSLATTYPNTNQNRGLLVRTELQARTAQNPNTAVVVMLLALAMAVLLVACANVAGLLTSRAPARAREIALRLAIGGSRLGVIRQLLIESALIALCGGVVGVAAAAAVLLLPQVAPISDLGVQVSARLDRRMLLVGLVAATSSALLSSLIPAWRATQGRDLVTPLRNTAVATRKIRAWGRNGLVAGQVALSLMLLTVAVFLYRAFQTEYGRGPGFRLDHLLLTAVDPAMARYDERQTAAFYRRLRERLETTPGVRSVGVTSALPMDQDVRDRAVIVPEGHEFPAGIQNVTIQAARVDEGYLNTMGIRVVSGRGFLPTDTAESPPVVIVNQTLARRYWPGQDSLGKRIRLRGGEGPWAEIVGVAADSKYTWIAEAPTPFLYVPHMQDPVSRTTIVVGTEGDPAALAGPLREVVRSLDAAMPIGSVRTMEELYRMNVTSTTSRLVQTVGSMGIVGLILALVGLYGLVSYAVARRTREIGIRMAIGASPSTVLRMVLRYGLTVAVCGTVAGLVTSSALNGVLRATFPSTSGIDVVSYAVVMPVLVLLVLVASYIPARRAAQIDPLVAFKQE
jgi:predicted permease